MSKNKKKKLKKKQKKQAELLEKRILDMEGGAGAEEDEEEEEDDEETTEDTSSSATVSTSATLQDIANHAPAGDWSPRCPGSPAARWAAESGITGLEAWWQTHHAAHCLDQLAYCALKHVIPVTSTFITSYFTSTSQHSKNTR